MFQRNNPKSIYSTGGNYPAQTNTEQASVSESEKLNPSVKRTSIDQYMEIMQSQLGAIAQDVAYTKAMVAQAEDRYHLLRITSFNTDVPIPNAKYWRTCYISRPSMAESIYVTGLTAKDLTLYFDDSFAVLVPFNGQIVIPDFGYASVRAVNTGPGGAGTYPKTWALDMLFTSRQYNPTQWSVSA